MPLRPAVLILQGLWLHYAARWFAGVLNGIALPFIFFACRHHAVMENGRQITPTKSGNTSKGPGDQILKPNQ